MSVGIESKGKLAAQVWRAFRELSPKGVAKEARRPVRLGVVASAALCQDVAAFLVGNEPDAYDRASDSLLLMTTPLDPGAFDMLPRCDALVVAADCHEVLPGIASERVLRFDSATDLPVMARELTRSQTIGYAQIALARAFAGLRTEAAAATIQTVSIENAAFVVSTSLGNIIPNPLQPLAAVAETVGDVVVLTANQLRMLFRLAAIFGRDLGLKQQGPEVMSIIGAAFGWRSIARELAGAMPLGVGIVPKAAIAFAGTWAVGDGIAFYYSTGRRLTKEEIKGRFDEAYEKGKAAAESLATRVKDGYNWGRARLMNKPGAGD